MIRTGGETVAPPEVEAVLGDHPDVIEVAVVGVPDMEWGEIVTAVIVARPGRARGDRASRSARSAPTVWPRSSSPDASRSSPRSPAPPRRARSSAPSSSSNSSSSSARVGRYAAAAAPNHVASVRGSSGSARSPTHATCPSGRISTAGGASTAPMTGSSHTPECFASTNRTRSGRASRNRRARRG